MTTPTAPAATPGGASTTPAAGPRAAGARRRPGEFGASGGGRKFTPRRKVCAFCVDKIKEVDYKDLTRLRRFLSERGKIEPRRKTGTCAAHQRSFTAEHIRVTGVLVREPGAPPFRGGRGPRVPEGDGVPDGAAADGAATETTDGAAQAPAADTPEAVAESPAVQGVRETPASGPAAQEA
jgi:small subunit ribosomal protein S18